MSVPSPLAVARARLSAVGRREHGFTLVEMLLAVSILGVGVLTVVSGMMTSIRTSDLQRHSAEAQTAIRAYAEAVAGATYQDCATSYAGGFGAPSGFSLSQTVTYWVPSGSSGSFAGACPSPDQGLQRITLTVAATDGRATETLSLAKRKP
jgi:prepilin-type N-terminal cleavage/methylation domain-containing protein